MNAAQPRKSGRLLLLFIGVGLLFALVTARAMSEGWEELKLPEFNCHDEELQSACGRIATEVAKALPGTRLEFDFESDPLDPRLPSTFWVRTKRMTLVLRNAPVKTVFKYLAVLAGAEYRIIGTTVTFVQPYEGHMYVADLSGGLGVYRQLDRPMKFYGRPIWISKLLADITETTQIEIIIDADLERKLFHTAVSLPSAKLPAFWALKAAVEVARTVSQQDVVVYKPPLTFEACIYQRAVLAFGVRPVALPDVLSFLPTVKRATWEKPECVVMRYKESPEELAKAINDSLVALGGLKGLFYEPDLNCFWGIVGFTREHPPEGRKHVFSSPVPEFSNPVRIIPPESTHSFVVEFDTNLVVRLRDGPVLRETDSAGTKPEH